jgi:hypothetical protein
LLLLRLRLRLLHLPLLRLLRLLTKPPLRLLPRLLTKPPLRLLPRLPLRLLKKRSNNLLFSKEKRGFGPVFLFQYMFHRHLTCRT